MSAHPRPAVVTALLGVVCLIAALPFYRGTRGLAQPAPMPALLAPSAEPPLAGQPPAKPLMPAPPAEQPPAKPLMPPAPAEQPPAKQPVPVPLSAPLASIPHSAGSANPTDPPTPVVVLRVRVPASVAAGQDVEYRICLENRSQAPAHHVIVRDPLPSTAQFVRATPEPTSREPELIWQLGTLEAGACREIVLVLKPTGTGDITNCARVQFEHGECVTTRIARPALKVSKCGPKQAVLYDNLSYQVSVTNTGKTEATGVAVTDALPEGLEHSSGKNTLSWNLGKIAPGECRQVDYQVIAKKSGKLCNKAVAVAEGGLRSEAESCVVVGEAKLALEAEGPERRMVTRPAIYQVTVSNPGNMPATDVYLLADVPAGTKLVSASDGGGLLNQTVRFALGTLPPNGRRSVQVVLQAEAPGEVILKANATAARGLKAQAEVHTVFDGATGLTADVDVKDNPVEVGAETAYAITLLNQGSSPATEVQVVAQVPEQFTVVEAKGPAPHRQEGQQITFEPLPLLKPRGEARYEIRVKAQRPGDVRIKVDLSAKELPAGPVHREQSTNIYQPDVLTPKLQPPEAMPAPTPEPPR